MLIVDKLAYSSPLRGKSPLLKSAFSVGILFICVGARSLIICAAVMIIMGYLTAFSAGAGLFRFLKLMAIPSVFIIPSGIILLFEITPAGITALWQTQFLTQNISITVASLSACIYGVSVSFAAVSCLYFLALSTPFTDLLWVLKKIHCPKIMIELSLLIYRFVFILFDMASNMMTARKCRLGNKNLSSAVHGQGAVLAMLLARALKRSSQLYDAMESRLYDGEISVISITTKATKREIVGVISVLVLFGTAAIVILVMR